MPDDCWLADQDGQRYTSERRLRSVPIFGGSRGARFRRL